MIKLIIDNKEYSFEKFTKVSDCLMNAGFELSNSYSENPIVGAFYNSRAVSLSSYVQSSGRLDVIRAFDSLGRRIYRHSLCYLLCYSAKLVYPKRRLVIGHSLGDGFYFSFSDDGEFDISLISSKMESLCNEKLFIEESIVPFDKAYCFFKNNNLHETAKLLSFKNEPEVKVFCIKDYMDVAYEPIVPNTELLSVWELKPYKSGMLLRYPVSSDTLHIASPFRDNENLFAVFDEYKRWGKILGVPSVGEMNKKISEGSVDSYVRLCESLQRRKIALIADMIAEKAAKAVFVAGPSSSGKTTFAKKLCEQLSMLGYETIRISLDDYYKPRTELPLNSKGEPDYECVEALRFNLFEQNMLDIFNGKEVFLPEWNFAKQQQTLRSKSVKLSENTKFVIEGIHGLNPKFMETVPEKDRFSVYISALTQLNLDDHNRVSTTDNRIIRRIVRDNRTRGVEAIETLQMWSDVEKGERIHIFPFQNNADVMFNSALDYELGVLSSYVTPLLMEVGPENKQAYSMARRLLKFLHNFYSISERFVPSDSILREFIGQSDYE